MKITSVNIPQDILGNGLSDIKMNKLGDVIILTGKNGSGKSRIIDVLMQLISKCGDVINQDSREKIVNNVKTQIDQHNENIEMSIQKLKSCNDNDSTDLEFYNEDIRQRKATIQTLKWTIPWDYIDIDDKKSKPNTLRYIPKSKNLQDPNRSSKNDLYNTALQVNTVGIENLAVSALYKIQDCQNKWMEVTHQSSTVDDSKKSKITNEYQRLKEAIRVFVNADLGRNEDGDATLFGFRIGDARMSSGQNILLQYAIAVHSHGTSLNNTILFFDEPENSLHPSAIIETIERIRTCNPNGQIWIATHSIPILAHFDPSCIWYVDDGKVSHAGKIPEKVLESLLGGEDERGRLQDFINLPAVYALNMHAYESLFQPQAVETDKNDPQTLQIRDELKAFLKDNDKIKVLDYGAGKGRLLRSIIEHNNQTKEEFTKWFDYVAYDRFDGDKEHCINTIKQLYDTAEIRYFNDNSKIYEKHDKNSFDVVVMCNVLHEIDPKEWLDLFQNIIPEMLSENGILLLVEDHEMPIGEKAYQKGYIVLDTTELKDLFNIKGDDLGYNDARGDGRLKAHRIKRQYLLNITAETRKKALESLHKKARNKVLEIRGKDLNYMNGKKHGFWLQQYANTGLVLNEL